MILAVDIGNTMTKIGLHDGTEWRQIQATPTEKLMSESACSDALRSVITLARVDTIPHQMRAGLCSVVPAKTNLVERAIVSVLGIEPLIVSATLSLPIKLAVEQPSRLGADRIANMVAARLHYCAAAVVIDCGTATKYDVLDSHGTFLGGVITTGIQSAMDALTSRTAQLPPVAFAMPDRVIGRFTEEALQSGAYYSKAGEFDRILTEILSEVGLTARDCKFIGTGGLYPLIAPAVHRWNVTAHPHLTLEGIRLLAVS